jgi:hypothetical protein
VGSTRSLQSQAPSVHRPAALSSLGDRPWKEVPSIGETPSHSPIASLSWRHRGRHRSWRKEIFPPSVPFGKL